MHRISVTTKSSDSRLSELWLISESRVEQSRNREEERVEKDERSRERRREDRVQLGAP